MLKKIIVLGFLAIALNCVASSIQWGVITYLPNSKVDWSEEEGWITFSSFEGIPKQGALNRFEVCFLLELSSLGATLSRGGTMLLGYDSSLWRVVDEGDFISYDTMFTGQDDYFSNDWKAGPWSDVFIRTDETVILAFMAGNIFWEYENGGAEAEKWYRYGWVELGYNGTDIYIVNSAMETTGLGIYAGTGSVIPEPATALLALSGLALLWRRRRKSSGDIPVADDIS